MASKYNPLTRGPLRDGDQVLFADFVQDCEAKKRWHRVTPDRFGQGVIGLRRRNPALKFRRPS